MKKYTTFICAMGLTICALAAFFVMNKQPEKQVLAIDYNDSHKPASKVAEAQK